MKRRFISALAITLFLVTKTYAPFPASAKLAMPRIQLAKVNHVVGSHPSVIQVHISRKVTVRNPLLSGKDVRVYGKGDFVGFALVRESPNGNGAVYLGGRLPKPAGYRHFLFDASSFFADGITRHSLHLHPGNYRLYLLPGQGPASLHLRLHGLKGQTELRPTDRVTYDFSLPETRYSVPSGHYYSAGGVGSLDGRGLVFGAVWTITTAHAATNSDFCFWRSRPSEVVGYIPNCGDLAVVEPGNLWAESGTTDYRATVGRSFRIYYGAWQPFQSGFSKPGLRYGHSVILESASDIESIGSLALWLSYE